jgi:hypothetical protein
LRRADVREGIEEERLAMSGSHRPNPIPADDREALACRLDVVEQAGLMAEYERLAETAVSDVRRAGRRLQVSVSRSVEADARVDRIVAAEHACCPFMDVTVHRDAETLLVTYSGPDAIEAVLDMIEARVRPASDIKL